MENEFNHKKFFIFSSVLASISYLFKFWYDYYIDLKNNQLEDLKTQTQKGPKEFINNQKGSFYFFANGNAYLEKRNWQKREDKDKNEKDKDLIYKEVKQIFYKPSNLAIEDKKMKENHIFNYFNLRIESQDFKVIICPNFDVITLGLIRQENYEQNLFDSIIFLLKNILNQLKGEISLELKQFLIKEGDNISVFGESIYDEAKKIVTVNKPLYIMGGGMKYLKSYIKNELKMLSNKEMLFKYSAYGLMLLSGFFLYNIFKSWFKNNNTGEKEEDHLDEITDSNENSKCIICLIKNKNRILYPCMHLCICNLCYESMNKKECPICKKRVINLIKLQKYQEENEKLIKMPKN